MKYQFTDASGENFVDAEKLYEIVENKISYGFLTEVNRNANERLQYAELNDGFFEIYWLNKSEFTRLKSDELGVYANYQGEGDIPVTFVSDVDKEGNYMVTVKIAASEDVSEAKVFIGRRRIAFLGNLKKGEVKEITALANICSIIPRGSSEPMDDLTCDVTIVGKGLRVQRIEIEIWEGKTLFIAGDSTVTDQSAAYPYLPGQSYCAWGQMIGYYVGNQMAVSNHAHSGLTVESFRSEGHYKILFDHIKAGDVCMFQFGHNDQKLMHLKADEGYTKLLTDYIEEIRSKGAIPVVVSPLARNSWVSKGDEIVYNDLLEPYQKACKKLCEKLGVAYIELHDVAMNFVKELGRDSAKRYFFPSDYTHSNDYGAFLWAGVVYEGLVGNGLMEQKEMISWEPPVEMPELVIPEEFKGITNSDALELLKDIDRPEDELTRVEAMDFIIQTCKFFPTNVYNDMYSDVIGHETYAGTVETAYQNGMIPESMTADGCFHPEQKISLREFLVSLMHGYSARKPLSSAHPNMIQEAMDMQLIPGDIEKDVPVKRSFAAQICRKINV